MVDQTQNFELVLPKNVIEKCYFLKPGDGAKFLSTNFRRRISSQLKLYKQDDESVRIGIEVSPVKTVNAHQPEFICIEGATKEFAGSYVQPDDYMEDGDNSAETIEQLAQEKSRQELIKVINKTLKTVDDMDKLGESSSESEDEGQEGDTGVGGSASEAEEESESSLISNENGMMPIIIPKNMPESVNETVGAVREVKSTLSKEGTTPLSHPQMSPKAPTDIAMRKMLQSTFNKVPDTTICYQTGEKGAIEDLTDKPKVLTSKIDTDFTCHIIIPRTDTRTNNISDEANLESESETIKVQTASDACDTHNEKKRKHTTEACQDLAKDKKNTYKREKNLSCPLCDSMLKDYDSVNDHVKSSHKNDEHAQKILDELKQKMKVKCEICEKELCNKDQLSAHIRSIHWIGPPAKCPHCDGEFRSIDHLKHHIKRIHTDKEKERKFLCHLCPASFRLKPYLTNHVKLVHSSNAKDTFKCNQCDHTCSTEKYLKNHIGRVHSGRKFDCKYCSKAFKTSANMNRHVQLMHEKANQRPFQCEECGKRFSLKANMMEHVINTHQQKPRFQCDLCKMGFRLKKQLQSHQCFATQISSGQISIVLPSNTNLLHATGDSTSNASIIISESDLSPVRHHSQTQSEDDNVEYQYIIATPEMLRTLNQDMHKTAAQTQGQPQM